MDDEILQAIWKLMDKGHSYKDILAAMKKNVDGRLDEYENDEDWEDDEV